MSKSLDGLDTIEMFKFEREVANFGSGERKIKKNLHFSDEIAANIAIVDTIEKGYNIPFIPIRKSTISKTTVQLSKILMMSRMLLMICYPL